MRNQKQARIIVLFRKISSRLAINEAGAVAVFFASIMGILLLVGTTSAAQLMVSELNQSTQVDQSEQAYFAAEAGVEDALYHIEQSQQLHPLIQVSPYCIFPQQFNDMSDFSQCSANLQYSPALSTEVGDYSILGQNSGNLPQNYAALADPSPNPTADAANVTWRNRKVYDSTTFYVGTQQKDQTLQIDASDLRRHRATGDCGIDAFGNSTGLDCDNATSIFSDFGGLEYCWQAPAGTIPSIELTTVSWAASSVNPLTSTVTNVLTDKALFTTPPGGATQLVYDGTTYIGALSPAASTGFVPNLPGFGNNCIVFQVDSARRYIFRIKPLFPVAGINNVNQAGYAVQYQANLFDTVSSPFATDGQLYIPNNAYYIDVVGQAGDVRRRIVAKVLDNRQLIGVFDYILYSGDPVIPLCKAGVAPYYNTATCIAIPGP
ncbi:MAG: hypothetical protein ACHQUB_02430 [Candidatus Saccharimonadia bacterium]